MTKEELIKELEEQMLDYFVVRQRIVKIIDDYMCTNHIYNGNYYDLFCEDDLMNQLDSPALTTAWIQDKLNGKLTTDKDSLTRKIRKVLGYTYP